MKETAYLIEFSGRYDVTSHLTEEFNDAKIYIINDKGVYDHWDFHGQIIPMRTTGLVTIEDLIHKYRVDASRLAFKCFHVIATELGEL